MKRMISMLLVCAALCGLFAGCGKKQNESTPATEGSTAPSTTQAQGPASALEALEAVWNRFAEEEKFWIVGGDHSNPVDNAPGKVNLSAADYLTSSLLVPEAQLSAISEAASMMHAMNGNNFTCGVYKVADVNGFATAMKEAILGNQWICGMPEILKITDLGGGFVLVAFGIGDAMDPFFVKLAQAHPQAVTLVDESIA